MNHQSGRWVASANGPLKGIDHYLMAEGGPTRPLNHAPGIQVDKHTQIQPTFPGGDVGNIHPDLIRMRLGEFPVEVIRCDQIPMLRIHFNKYT
jgi:hypothetical protein